MSAVEDTDETTAVNSLSCDLHQEQYGVVSCLNLSRTTSRRFFGGWALMLPPMLATLTSKQT